MSEDAHLSRLKATITKGLVEAQADAIENLKEVVKKGTAEGDVDWAKNSTRTRVSLALAQASLAAERAKTMSEAPRVFGMVLMQARIEDPKQWEEMAAATDTRVIEAAVVPALPLTEFDRWLAGQLGWTIERYTEWKLAMERKQRVAAIVRNV